jgi:hypothetical protein
VAVVLWVWLGEKCPLSQEANVFVQRSFDLSALLASAVTLAALLRRYLTGSVLRDLLRGSLTLPNSANDTFDGLELVFIHDGRTYCVITGAIVSTLKG